MPEIKWFTVVSLCQCCDETQIESLLAADKNEAIERHKRHLPETRIIAVFKGDRRDISEPED